MPIHVLCVGASNYAAGSGFTSLKICAEDARRVAQTFREVKELNADPLQVRLLVSSDNGTPALQAIGAATADFRTADFLTLARFREEIRSGPEDNR